MSPRNRDGSVLGTATAVSPVPFARVRPLISDSGVATLLGSVAGHAGITTGAEPDESMVWLHGNFWYQGEYAFADDPHGTRVTYTIRNISGRPDALIRLWQRRLLRARRRQLELFAGGLADRVGNA